MRKWVSFESLNELFDIKSKRKGAWIDTSKDEPLTQPESFKKMLSEIAKTDGRKMPTFKGKKHTKDARKKISKAGTGNKKRRRAIEVDGVVYPTVRGAMKVLGVGFIRLKEIGRMVDK